MKAYTSILPVLFCLLLFSCGEKTTETVVTPESNNRVSGKLTQPQSPQGETPGLEVESTQLPNPEFDDAGVDYAALAKEICACAEESNQLNTKMQNLAAAKKSSEFAKLAPKVNAAFQESIKCSQDRVKALNSEFSPFNLVPELKANCGELDADLVTQILRGLGVAL